eukprot:209104_1
MLNYHQRTAPPCNPSKARVVPPSNPSATSVAPPSNHSHSTRTAPPLAPNHQESSHQIGPNVQLPDQIYLIFKQCIENKSITSNQLILQHLLQLLHDRFQTTASKETIDGIRWIHILPSNQGWIAHIHFYLDDICPHGAHCPHGTHCTRIHFINQFHWCACSSRNHKCDDTRCRMFHVNLQHLTHYFLSMILLRYHRDGNANKPGIRDYYVKDCDIQRLYTETNHPPLLPCMSYIDPNDIKQRSHLWRSMLQSYNKYYFDYEAQHCDPHFNPNGTPYIVLWETESYREHTFRVRIKMNHQFFVRNTCHNYATPSSDDINDMCLFSYRFSRFPYSLCPYFHIRRNVFALMMENGTHYSELAESMTPAIGNCLMRSGDDLKYEVNQIENGCTNHMDLILLPDSKHVIHQQWCDIVQEMCAKYQPNASTTHVRDIAWNKLRPDERMDAGFHRHSTHSVIIQWQATEMTKPMKVVHPLQSIAKIKNLFNALGETPVDIAMDGLEKFIIIEYGINRDIVGTFVMDLSKMFGNIPRRCAYNRRISISTKTQVDPNDPNTICLMIEFQNVNVFVSVTMMAEWFEKLIVEYDKLKLNGTGIMDCMQRIRGSFHFVYRRASRPPQTIATVYFKHCNLNPNNTCIGNIRGAPVYIVNGAYGDHLQREYALYRKFIQYKMIGWALLCKQNQTDLHYKQYEKIQMMTAHVQPSNGNHIPRAQSIQKSQSCPNGNQSNHRRSPPRQHTDIISRRRGPPPPNHMNNEYKNGYEETKTPSPVPYEIIMSPLRLPSPNPIGKSTSVQVHQMNGDKQSYDYSSEDSSAEGLASVYREGIHLDKGLIAMARHDACGNLNGKDIHFEEEYINELCRYCNDAVFTTEHITECWFIPTLVKEEYMRKHNID